jgi:hypothetical protein
MFNADLMSLFCSPEKSRAPRKRVFQQNRPKAGIAAFGLTAGKPTFVIAAILTGSDTSERIGNHPSRPVQTLDVRKATVM